MTVKATGTQLLSLDKSTQPQLSLVDPKLWWPSGYGEQNLYDLALEFKSGDAVSDVNKSRIGIHEYTYNQPSLTRWDLSKLVNGAPLTTDIQNPLSSLATVGPYSSEG